jgi:hypothetical protein
MMQFWAVNWTRRRFLKSAAVAGCVRPVGAASALQAAEQASAKTDDDAAKIVDGLRPVEVSHPRLHFSAEGRKSLRARAQHSHRRYAALLLAWVEQNRQWMPPSKPSPEPLNEVVLEQCAAFLTNAALAFTLSEREEHLELARCWATAMCKAPLENSKNYGLGLYAAGLARAYDWLFEHWSNEERDSIQAKIVKLVRRIYSGSFPEADGAFWWAGVHLHHDFWVPTGGYGEAALALLGEVDEAAQWAARAKHEFKTCFSWLGDDGAWAEGAADWCYAMAPLLWFYGAWQSVTGENLHDIPWLRHTALFRQYHRLPDGSYVYLNDSFRSGRYNTSGSASCHLLRRLASLFRDGYAQWLADRDEVLDLKPGDKGVYQAPYEGLSFHAQRNEYPHSASQCAAWNMLWFDPSVKSSSPENLPQCRRFPNQDVAILRTGWGDRAAVVSLSCGPLAGHRCAERVRRGELRNPASFYHMHAAYNSLTFFAAGQYFLVPPGYARRGSGFQNTVTVNGADSSTDPAADVRLVGLIDQPDFSYAVGEATEGFLKALGVEHYRRHLLLLSDCMVMYDDLRLSTRDSRNWNRLQWTLHSNPQTHLLSIDNTSAMWQASHAVATRLILHVLEPAEFAWERATLQSQEGTPMLEALRLVRPEWYTTRMQVLAVLSWAEKRTVPATFRREQILGVIWPDYAERLAVGFTRARLGKARPDWLAQPDWPNRSLLMLSDDGASLDYRRWQL